MSETVRAQQERILSTVRASLHDAGWQTRRSPPFTVEELNDALQHVSPT